MTRRAGSVRAYENKIKKYNSFSARKRQRWRNMFLFGPPPLFSFLTNAGAMIYRTSEKYRYKDDVACSKMHHCKASCRARSSPVGVHAGSKVSPHFIISLSTVSRSALMAACNFRVWRMASSLVGRACQLPFCPACLRINGLLELTEQIAIP